MLKAVLLGLTACGLLAASAARAEDETPVPRKRGQVTEEQRALMKEIRGKYDANKDGKLDETERKAISAEDKEKLAKAGLGPRKRRNQE